VDVSRPASRVLAVLEMLQNRPGVNGPTIAAELGVDTRTVRRYVATLAEMGIPVAATAGRHGGYRLMPGFRLPPLMFSADEAVGLAVALLATSAASDDLPPVVASAFTKIRRVLPRDLAQQVQALHDVAVFPAQRSAPARGFPDPAVLAALARGVLAHQRCSIVYQRDDEPESRRELDPYGIVALHGRWYVHGYCHLRRGRRTFRVDRITRAHGQPFRFQPPDGVDVPAEVERSLTLGRRWPIEIVVAAAVEQVRAQLPRHFAQLEPIDGDRTLLRSSTSNLDWFARRIGDLPFRLCIRSPAELRDALRHNAAALLEMAATPREDPTLSTL
jgi:predicted DNA-binding transcriptional regulator YafY